MRWLDSITDSMDMKLSKLQEIVHGIAESWIRLSDSHTHTHTHTHTGARMRVFKEDLYSEQNDKLNSTFSSFQNSTEGTLEKAYTNKIKNKIEESSNKMSEFVK